MVEVKPVIHNRQRLLGLQVANLKQQLILSELQFLLERDALVALSSGIIFVFAARAAPYVVLISFDLHNYNLTNYYSKWLTYTITQTLNPGKIWLANYFLELPR